MKHDDQNLPLDESLDRAIHEALQVNVELERLIRLEYHWLARSRQQHWRGRIQRVAAIAALLATVVALDVAWNRQAGQPRQPVESPGEIVEKLAVDNPTPADNGDVRAIELSAGRPPTAYERLVFNARAGTRPTVPIAAMLNSAIHQLSLHPDADARPLVDLPGLQQADVETILLRRLSRATDAEQVAILRLLAIRGTQRSVPTLLRLARHDKIREKALSTLGQIVGVGGLPQVVQSTTDPQLRADLMRRLLDAESKPALLGYLSLVRGEATRADALAVADTVPKLPIDELFALLDHPEQPLRFSAALVLGHVDGPEVTRRLIARVTEQPANSREAWMALLACRGKLADEFFAYATRRPQLIGYVNNARVQWSQMIP